MPLQNRVDPFGDLFADAVRGLLMGNRGGRLHDCQHKLGARRWTSKQWICCRLDFNDRHRKVWGDSYSELFFLDEVAALAAGHRPCFECRRKVAQVFAALFLGGPRAADMDRILHGERLDGKFKRLHWRKIEGLPDGTTIVVDGSPVALRGQTAVAVDAARLQRNNTATAWCRCRCTDAALDHRRTEARLPAFLAPERGLNFQGGSIGVVAGATGTPWAQANSTVAIMIASMAATKATQAGQPPIVQARPPSAAPKLPPT
jgi:hypothetical protein